MIRIHTKKKDRVFIKFFHRKQTKIITLSTQKYNDGDIMEKSLLDLMINIINQKKGMKTTEFKDFGRTLFVRLCGLKFENGL